MVCVFCAMNMNKVPYNDWKWYTDHFFMTKNFTLSEYLSSTIGYIKIKWNEPVYYFIARSISSITDNNISVLAFVITILDYGMVAWGTISLGSLFYDAARRQPNGVMLAAFCLFAITFTLVLHLVRQELAASIVILGLSFLANGKIARATLFAILAILTHQTAVVLVVILYGPLFIMRFLSGKISKFAAIIGLTIVVAAIGYVVSGGEMSTIGQKDDGSISTVILAFDAAIFCALIAVRLAIGGNNIYLNSILISFVMFYVMMASMSSMPLAVLRLYFYVDFIRAFSILIIAVYLTPRRLPSALNNMISFLLLASSLVYTNARIDRAPFDFGGSFIQYLSYPM